MLTWLIVCQANLDVHAYALSNVFVVYMWIYLLSVVNAVLLCHFLLYLSVVMRNNMFTLANLNWCETGFATIEHSHHRI